MTMSGPGRRRPTRAWWTAVCAGLACLVVLLQPASGYADAPGGNNTAALPAQGDPYENTTYSGATAGLGVINQIPPGTSHTKPVPPPPGNPDFYATAHSGPADGTPCLQRPVPLDGAWPTLGAAVPIPASAPSWLQGLPSDPVVRMVSVYSNGGSDPSQAGWYTWWISPWVNNDTAFVYWAWIDSYAEITSDQLSAAAGTRPTWQGGVCNSGAYDPPLNYVFHPVSPPGPHPPPTPAGYDPGTITAASIRDLFPATYVRSNVPSGGNFTVFVPGCFWLADANGDGPSEAPVVRTSPPQWGLAPPTGPPTVYAYTYTLELEAGTVSWDFGDGRGTAAGTGAPGTCGVTHTYKQVSDVLTAAHVAPVEPWGVPATAAGVTVTAQQQVSARAFYQYWDGSRIHIGCWNPATRTYQDAGPNPADCAPFATVTVEHHALGPTPVYQVLTVPYAAN